MTIHDLSESGEFQGLFQFQFEEAVNVGRKERLDVFFPNAALFEFSTNAGDEHHGRFTGEVELLDEASGETTGSFQLLLPAGWESRQRSDVLEGATLTVKIERVPSDHVPAT